MPTVQLDLQRAALIFHALSDETRLAVLEMLADGERCVCDLQDALDVAQSRLSFHLKVLKESGLVTDRKEGRWSYYQLAMDTVDEAHDMVRALTADRTKISRASARPPRRAKSTLNVLDTCCG